ncbi:DUF402 domain-containing protein [Thermogladius sp. 4427co]|uniref:DUF402 domain-containing protein n=1 Tax=Thermogladius sp. 4427co TaxID=3450718 RepID=UPI003F78D676
MFNIRVRGVSSTSLSYIFLNRGFRIVQSSEVISRRLNIPFDPSPAEVTVKDSSEPGVILVVGSRNAVEKVLEVLREEVKGIVIWRGDPGLHSVHKARVVKASGNECILRLASGKEAILKPCSNREGDLVLVGITRTAFRKGDTIIASREIRVDGLYISLIKGSSRIEFSEYIRDEERRAELTALAVSKLIGSNIGVRFRSNSRYGELEAINREFDELLGVLKDIEAKSRSTDVESVLYEGEGIALVYLTSVAKERLDEVRSKITATSIGHHELKYKGLDDLVDYTEFLISKNIIERERSRSLLEYILARDVGREYTIIQWKPTGERLELTPGTLVDVSGFNGDLVAVFKRIIRSSGVYDGLGIEKKPGDIDYMVVKKGSWLVSHNYYRGEEYLGSYININTPPEIAKGVVEYMDLEVDVIVYPDGSTKVIDLDKLEEEYRQGLIDEEVYRKARETVEAVVKNPRVQIYNP